MFPVKPYLHSSPLYPDQENICGSACSQSPHQAFFNKMQCAIDPLQQQPQPIQSVVLVKSSTVYLMRLMAVERAEVPPECSKVWQKYTPVLSI